MATYVNDLRLKEIATGDESGTWGASTNTNLELIAEAFSFGTEAITTNADTHTTTIADGSTDPGRSIYLKYTGTLDSACTITIGPNTVSKLWFIENGTSGSQNIIISQGSGANVTIPAGHVKAVYSDGAGSGAAIVDAFTDLNLAGTTTVDILSGSGNATIGGTLGVTGIVTLTDDLIIGDGKTIGSASDVDAMTIASNGQVTFSQTLIGTALDISGDIDVDGTSNLDVVDIDGAVDMASTLAVGGVVTANAGVVVDNITIDGTEIDLSSGDLTIDVAGDIILDAGGGDFDFLVGGTEVGSIIRDGSNLQLKSSISDGDMIFRGNDGGSIISALTLDMSNAGSATFNKDIFIGDGNPIRFGDDQDGRVFYDDTNGFIIQNATSDKDILFKGNDGGSTITALTLDMSNAGRAAFNENVTVGGNLAVDGADFTITANVIHAGDTNTFFGFVSDDTFRIVTSGSEALRVDSSQRVGIGTSSPSEILTVAGNIANVSGDMTLDVAGDIILDADDGFINLKDGGTEFGTLFKSSDSFFIKNPIVDGDIKFQVNDGGSGVVAFQIDASDAGTATFNNKVGIGTTSPASLLSLQGDAEILRLDGTANTTRTIFFRNTTAANPAQIHSDGSLKLRAEDSGTHIEFHTVDTERLRIDSSGNVGIGTASPAESLHTTGNIRFGDSAPAELYTNSSEFRLGVDRNNDNDTSNITFYTNNSEKVRIDKDGDVGIGTTSPATLLELSADGTCNFRMSDSSSPSTFAQFVSANGVLQLKADSGDAQSSSSMQFHVDASERMRIDSSGNLLVGSTTDHEGKVQIAATNEAGLFVRDSSVSNSAPYLRVQGQRSDGNTGESFTGGLVLESYRTDAAVPDDKALGTIYFGGNHTNGTESNISYAASIIGIAEGAFNSATDMPTGLAFLTGDAGTALKTANTSFGTERMRIDHDGKVGIGTTSPGQKLDVAGSVQFGDGGSGVALNFNATGNAQLKLNGTERMRIDSSGVVMIGTTDSTQFNNTSGSGIAIHPTEIQVASTNNCLSLNHSDGDGDIAKFFRSGSQVGSISVASSSTTYATSSDARLKDVTGSARGLEVINKLNPVAYNWKADGKADEGLIAQEVLDVVPNAVSGSEEDMYQMDYSKLVTHLVKAVQEQQEQIESLTSEIAILKEK